jgi:hypothetical protein
MTVIDMNAARAERERRKLERKFNPTPAQELGEAVVVCAIAVGCLMVSFWILGPSDFKAEFNAWLAQQEGK